MAIVELTREQQIDLLETADLDRLVEVYRPLAESVASRYAQGGDVAVLAESVLRSSLVRAKASYRARAPDYRFDTYLTYYFVKAVERRLED